MATTHGYIADYTDDYYLAVGRLVATKRLDILIEACNRTHRKLLIVGTGRDKNKLRSIAGPYNQHEFLGLCSYRRRSYGSTMLIAGRFYSRPMRILASFRWKRRPLGAL